MDIYIHTHIFTKDLSVEGEDQIESEIAKKTGIIEDYV
jgi:hypothetical protein